MQLVGFFLTELVLFKLYLILCTDTTESLIRQTAHGNATFEYFRKQYAGVEENEKKKMNNNKKPASV